MNILIRILLLKTKSFANELTYYHAHGNQICLHTASYASWHSCEESDLNQGRRPKFVYVKELPLAPVLRGVSSYLITNGSNLGSAHFLTQGLIPLREGSLDSPETCSPSCTFDQAGWR